MRARWLAILALLLLAACTPVVMPAGAPQGPPAIARDAVLTPDGARLPFHAWLPEGPPRAILLGLHGFGDYSFNAFDLPAPLLTAQGIAVYAYDQRGFGAAPHRGYWPGSATLAEDVSTVARLLAVRHPGVPITLLGESMGAAVALVAATSEDPPPVAGLILMAPGIRGRAAMGAFARRTLEIAAHAIPAVGFSGSAPGFSPTDNEEAMRRWGRDPLTTKTFRVDLVYGLVELMDRALAAAPRLGLRTLILYGGEDRIVPEAPVRQVMRALDRGAPVTLAYYPKGHHLLLRDNDRAVVSEDIAAWLAVPGAPLPSGAEAAAARWLAEAK
ncbi:lysophospholipase [Belnapia sp. T6]|uniref:Lysophospholipase n=1 Tax=Belnapia mucosa TaxID=2804532 RepID=A0ABS1V5R5_9PROT|nr:alpha/beta hydrolase [Belnapia mucosa]MBL6457033.1 lysophospholipase [Belnapia mucosa]